MNVKGFVDSLPILLYGMAGIFVVIGIIFVSIKLMGWIFPYKKGKEEDE
jgi:hypothetical protein